jgi:HEPN domain-containing protein
MKLNKEEALRWLDQAEHNLEVAKINFNSKFYSDACFMAEQTSQVALKAFIICNKKRKVWEHSIQELTRISSDYDKRFESLIEAGKILDKYYVPTRYPDALPSPAVPYKTYNEKDAREALSLAEEIVKLVKKVIKGEE